MFKLYEKLIKELIDDLNQTGVQEISYERLLLGRKMSMAAFLLGCIPDDITEKFEKIVCSYSIMLHDGINYLAYETTENNIFILSSPYCAYLGYFDKDYKFHNLIENLYFVLGFPVKIFELRAKIKKLKYQFTFLNFINKLTLNFQKKKRKLVFATSNLGHHIWNEEPYIDFLIKNNLLKNIKQAIFYVDYFNLSKWFNQNKIKNKHTKQNFVTSDILIGSALHRYPQKTSDRLFKFCLENSKYNSKNNTIIFCQRWNQRIWLEEKDGLVQIINYLSDKFPCLNFVIDGFSSPSCGKINIKTKQSIDLDINQYNQIYNKLSNDAKNKTTNIIGYSCVDKVAIYNNAILLVMPYGTPEHYNWIVNKPIITYGPIPARRLSSYLNSNKILKDTIIDNSAVDEKYIFENDDLNYNMDCNNLLDIIKDKLEHTLIYE